MMLRRILLLMLATALVVALVPSPAMATHNNQGTIKVHDDADENPDQRNVPHVSCDFWVEGFKMGDDSGWLEFFAWPPTGDMSSVTPSGANLTWTADEGDVSGEFHFLAGPYQLDAGHYRVEAFTDDGHPGGGGHFAKSKTFWVTPCEEDVTPPPCPPGVTATAEATGDGNQILVEWDAVVDVDGYVVYRAEEGGDFEMVASTDSDTTSFVDTDTVPGQTYEYYVTAHVDGVESESCEIVEATAIPFFPGLVLGAVALVGAVGSYAWFRRR